MKRNIYLFVMAALLTIGSHVFAQSKHEYVDLGLPSGTLWATCNVGAKTPTDYGNYYAWGETKPKKTYNASTYKFCKAPNYVINKYNRIDKQTTLKSSDDAASANWGKDWCMPSVFQFRELFDQTTHQWTEMEGVEGILFLSSNGESLFLPAAGYFEDKEQHPGGGGNYWTNSLDEDYTTSAWYIKFNSDNRFKIASGRNDRYGEKDRTCGFSVRAVRSNNKK